MKTRDQGPEDDLFRTTIADFEKQIILSALKQTRGNQSKAARRLGTTKRILAYRIRKYGIDIGQFSGTNDRIQ
jgi:transcriptional regulator with GAF, ATPase, and Fis domain